MSGFDFSNFNKVNPVVENNCGENILNTNNKDKKDNVTPIKPNIEKITLEEARKEAIRISKLITNIKKELNASFIEREHEINLLSLAFVSETNAFLHGVPGTGKSDLVESFANRVVGSDYFRLLMSKTTEPSEIFGPVSINSLKEDKYKVITKDKLPRADFAFLDETFKANSAVLNGLLTIMNEKIFFNDVKEDVPLISIVGASNEFPEDESLNALYDRFLLRWNVEPIVDINNRTKLFKSFLNRRNTNGIVHSDIVDSVDKNTTISLNDLKRLNLISRSVTFSKNMLEEYNKLFTQLEKEGVSVSDRRKNEAIKVIQANAVLEGRLEVEITDFLPLMYCFWNELDEIKPVVALISKLATPDNGFIEEYNNALEEMKNTVSDFISSNKDKDDFEVTKSIKLIEFKKSLSFAIDKIDEKHDSMRTESVRAKLKEIRGRYSDYVREVMDMLV